MKIVLAPDKFKGSLSAEDAAAAMERGVRRIFPAADCVRLRIGDGGEGTASALAHAAAGSVVREIFATGPLGRTVRAHYVLLGPDHSIAALDMASSAGLALIAPEQRSPMTATTYGVGESILAACGHGSVRALVIGLGGSATCDCGAGCLQALGCRLLDSCGETVPPPAGANCLNRVVRIDFVGLAPSLGKLDVTLACDVDNPLTGPTGAARVFGPQKGATPAMVEEIEISIERFGALLDRSGRSGAHSAPIGSRPGAGAAGGLGAALMAAFPSAQIRHGIEIVLDVAGFDQAVLGADLVIAGEGRLDSQTLSGKAVAGVIGRAKRCGVRAAVIAGSADSGAVRALAADSPLRVVELVRIAGSLEAALADPAAAIESAAAEIAVGAKADLAQGALGS